MKLWIDLPTEPAINRGQVAAIAKAFANTPDDNINFARQIKFIEGILTSRDYQNSDINWFSILNDRAAGISFYDAMSIIIIEPIFMLTDGDKQQAVLDLNLGCCKIFFDGQTRSDSIGDTVYIHAIQLMKLIQSSVKQMAAENYPQIAIPRMR